MTASRSTATLWACRGRWTCTACVTPTSPSFEAGFPERFVTDQVGHSWGSTTAIYCSVSDDFKNQVLAKAVAGAFRRPGQREGS